MPTLTGIEMIDQDVWDGRDFKEPEVTVLVMGGLSPLATNLTRRRS
jgi:hypothetical protein